MNFADFQDPVTAPSRMKEKQKSEFQVICTVHLTEPLYIVEKHKKSGNFKHFQLENPKSSTLQDESKSTLRNFINLDRLRQLYIF